MLFGKKKKIANYLEKKDPDFTIFDLILKEYLSGILMLKLKNLGLTKIEIHVDWLENIKMLGIQAKYKDSFLDIQVDEKELAIGCSKDEPDCDEFISFEGNLLNTNFIYEKIRQRINII